MIQDTEEHSMGNHRLDATGLNCPLPVLKTKKFLRNMKSGEILEVLCTDPGSQKDFSAFCNQTGNVLIESKEQDGIYKYLIKNTE